MRRRQPQQGIVDVIILVVLILAILFVICIVALVESCEDTASSVFEDRDKPEQCDTRDWWPDRDGDGYGDASAAVTRACNRPASYTCDHRDCDDTDVAVNPAQLEICNNGIDDNCDALTDIFRGRITLWPDADGDGFGADGSGAEMTVDSCEGLPPAGYATSGLDCAEADPAIHPGAIEADDGQDNDCDGEVDEGLYDAVLVSQEDQLGIALRYVGDIDGDGLADLMAGSDPVESLDSSPVAAWLIYGSERLEAGAADVGRLARATLLAPSRAEVVGATVAGLGDLDGDGLHELALGAPDGCSDRARCGGRVYLYYGRAGAERLAGPLPLEAADLVISSAIDRGRLGASISPVGDLDGDGRPDFAVGAPEVTVDGVETGAVYIRYGGDERLAGQLDAGALDATLAGSQAGDRFGASIRGGDLDGDGFSDLIVGVPGASAAGVSTGAAFVIYGGPERWGGVRKAGELGVRLEGELEGGALGAALELLDLDGDGARDLVFGAPGVCLSSGCTGTVYLRYGGDGRLEASGSIGLLAHACLMAPERVAALGAALSPGDFDGDGLADLAVGAPESLVHGQKSGRVLVLPGTVLRYADGVKLSERDALFTGITSSMRAGAAIDGTVDADGDGRTGLVIGAPGSEAASGGGVYRIGL